MRSRHLVVPALALTSLVASMLAGSVPAGASPGPQTYVIGVDAAGPTGHNFEYVDFFPRGQVLPNDPPAVVGNGAILDFRYNFGSLDGLHTATLLPSGETPNQAWAQHPLLIGDESEPAPPPNLIFNTDVIYQSPANCGDSAHPCRYTGAAEVNSGALPAFTPSGDFFVRIDVPLSSPTTIHYVCLIHPGMHGNVTVVPGGSSASSRAAFSSNVQSQFNADTADALAAESQAESTAVTSNGDGTNTVSMTAGTATQFVEVAEMLPRNVTVHPGDTVKWVTRTQKDPHTVSFPDLQENFSPQDPIQPACEGAAGDSAATGGPPDFGCGASPVEFVVDLSAQGPTQISSSTTMASSGVIATFGGLPDRYSFSFPNSGTYSYQCRIHDHMNGTITVTP